VIEASDHLPERTRPRDTKDLESVREVVADIQVRVVLLIVEAVIQIRQIVRNDLVEVFADEVDFWEAQNLLLFVFVQKRSGVMQRLLGDIGGFGTTGSMFSARTRLDAVRRERRRGFVSLN
jgi:hypothetical protein